MRFLSNINLNKNEIQNARIQNLATHPSSPVEGQVYFNSVDKAFYGFAGGQWVDLSYNYEGEIFTPEFKEKLEGMTSGATKVEESSVNGNILIDGEEVVVYTHPETHSADEIVETEEKQFSTSGEKLQWNENTVYTNDMEMVAGFGGISAGTTFDNVPLNELLTKLLYPYIAPTISFAGTPNGGTLEKGAKVDTVELRATVTKKSEKITRVRFYNGNTEIHSVEAPNEKGGTFIHKLTTPISANTSFKADCYDGKTNVTSGTIGFNFYHPAYVGHLAAESATPTQDEIKAMTKKIQAPGNLTHTYNINTQRMCVACPPGWTISKIFDANNFDVTASFAVKTVAVKCLDGSDQNYTVYVSEPTTQSNFAVKFNR